MAHPAGEDDRVPKTAFRAAIDPVAALCRGLAGAAFALVYPPTCPGCGRMTGARHGLCAACWQSLRLIERPYCEVLGLPFSHDLGAGILSAEAIADPPVFDRLRAAALHEGVARTLVHQLKYRDRTDLAPMMAAWMVRAGRPWLDEADLIIPVPLSRQRLFSRKFNQAAELARAISRQTGIAMPAAALIRKRHTERQVGLSARARTTNLAGAFAVSAEGRAALFGRRVVLVDDVYTTGATANAASRALKAAGAAEITVLTFAMALAEPI